MLAQFLTPLRTCYAWNYAGQSYFLFFERGQGSLSSLLMPVHSPLAGPLKSPLDQIKHTWGEGCGWWEGEAAQVSSSAERVFITVRKMITLRGAPWYTPILIFRGTGSVDQLSVVTEADRPSPFPQQPTKLRECLTVCAMVEWQHDRHCLGYWQWPARPQTKTIWTFLCSDDGHQLGVIVWWCSDTPGIIGKKAFWVLGSKYLFNGEEQEDALAFLNTRASSSAVIGDSSIMACGSGVAGIHGDKRLLSEHPWRRHSWHWQRTHGTDVSLLSHSPLAYP